jgi:uncharacterized membrane protein YqgA involved in biofilm formation
MIGVLVNTLAVITGSGVGLLFRRGIPEKISKAVMTAIGLCTLYLGISGALVGQNAIIVILALVLGTGLGTVLDIDGAIARLGNWVESRFRQPVVGGASIGEGFVTASLLFCIGSMTIVGSLNAGLLGDNTMLFAKSVLDLISSTMLAVSLGLGVLVSAAFVLVFQGAIVLLAQVLAPVFSQAAIAEMSCAGSILIIGLGLNLLQITKIKVADMLPAIVLAPVLVGVAGLF